MFRLGFAFICLLSVVNGRAIVNVTIVESTGHNSNGSDLQVANTSSLVIGLNTYTNDELLASNTSSQVAGLGNLIDLSTDLASNTSSQMAGLGSVIDGILTGILTVSAGHESGGTDVLAANVSSEVTGSNTTGAGNTQYVNNVLENIVLSNLHTGEENIQVHQPILDTGVNAASDLSLGEASFNASGAGAVNLTFPSGVALFGDNGTTITGQNSVYLDNVLNCANCTIMGLNINVTTNTSGERETSNQASDLVIVLINGSNNSEGRVSLFYNGILGTVCDDSWDDTDAGVICRGLSLGATGSAVASAEFGESTNDTILAGVQCTGAESSIADCPSAGLLNTDCATGGNAGVRCY